MNREQWLKTRKSKELNPELLYKFYVNRFEEKGMGKTYILIPIEVFIQIIHIPSILNEIIKSLDIYFEVQYIENDEGQILFIH